MQALPFISSLTRFSKKRGSNALGVLVRVGDVGKLDNGLAGITVCVGWRTGQRQTCCDRCDGRQKDRFHRGSPM